jgi:hypothetical protein
MIQITWMESVKEREEDHFRRVRNYGRNNLSGDRICCRQSSIEWGSVEPQTNSASAV